MKVYIDDTYVGDAGCLASRTDLAAFNPQFDTSQAGRCFTIDTTKFANGLHTIGWYVVDSSGNPDGIGGRFFRIFNAPPQPDAEVP